MPTKEAVKAPDQKEAGSGTAATAAGMVMVLSSRVTAADSAKALPDLMFAPVSRVMLASARIVP
jgi:hypothetical protein